MNDQRPPFRAALTLRRQLRFVDTRLSSPEDLSNHRRKRLERERDAYAFALDMIRDKHPDEYANAMKYDDEVRGT